MKDNHLLIVENSPGDRLTLLKALGSEYYLYEAESGSEAFRQIKESSIDLVIMALELPDVDGIEAFMEIKAKKPSLPFILTSSNIFGELILKAFRLGVRDFFKKPFKEDEIKEIVRLILKCKDRGSVTRRNVLSDRYICSLSTCMAAHSGIERAKKFLEENYDSPITLRYLAHEACLSRHHFSRSFKRETGLPYSRYLTMIRIEKAKELLGSRGLSVSEIATLVGFNEITYFERVFKRVVGLTPSSYRKKISCVSSFL